MPTRPGIAVRPAESMTCAPCGAGVLTLGPMDAIFPPEMTMVWGPATTMMNAVTKHSASPKAGLDTAQAAVEHDVAQLRKK